MIMSRHTPEAVKYAPFYVHSFRLVQPHKLVESEKFNIIYTDPSQIASTADKLRWYRYRFGLRQSDVANMIGIDRSTYNNYEELARSHYPIEIMERIAGIFSVPVTDLLDEFNLFLYYGQGKQIKQMRSTKQMTQKEFAAYINVPIGTLKKWEQDKVVISKSTWETLKLFR